MATQMKFGQVKIFCSQTLLVKYRQVELTTKASLKILGNAFLSMQVKQLVGFS